MYVYIILVSSLNIKCIQIQALVINDNWLSPNMAHQKHIQLTDELWSTFILIKVLYIFYKYNTNFIKFNHFT